MDYDLPDCVYTIIFPKEMAALKPQTPQKRFLKSLLIVTVAFLLTVLGLHIWFVNNARGVLKQIITTKSHGKIKLELSQLKVRISFQ